MPYEIIVTQMRRLVFVLSVIFVCVAVSLYFMKTISPDHLFNDPVSTYSDNIASGSKSKGYPTIGDGVKHLNIFMQISDLHLSIHKDKKRGPDFKDFCQNYVPVIKPGVVLVSGDLVDAKTKNLLGSMQYEQEWKSYKEIIDETKVREQTVWLDMAGNHDTFDISEVDSQNNFYREYSVQGNRGRGGYNHLYTGPGGDKVNFVSIDATLIPGPRRPFNFFGRVTQKNIDDLEQSLRQGEGSNHTIFFSHYPTSVIGGEVPQLRQILGRGMVYLAGHLHTLGGLVPHMYTIQHSGNLELELGDWMDNRIFRVFAVDHGLFSFVDQTLGDWPIVMVTNPKHGQFIIPGREPLAAMKQSTHIRILAFSPDPMRTLTVSIDGSELGAAKHVQGALYVLAWNPELYPTGEHIITVKAQDERGRSVTHSQPFALDGTRQKFNLLRRFLLMSHHPTEAKIMFVAMFLATVLPMLITRYISITLQVAPQGESRCTRGLTAAVQRLIRKYQMLASRPHVFWPLLLLHCYVAVGPWFIGEILRGHVGCMFVFGIYVHGTLLPGSLTFLYGFFQMLLYNFPLTLYLAHTVDAEACSHKRPCVLARAWLWRHGLFVVLVTYQLYQAVMGVYMAYGLMSLLLCPVRGWSAILGVVLRHLALTGNKQRQVETDNKQIS